MNFTTTRFRLILSVVVLSLYPFFASSCHAQSYTAGADARAFAMGGAGIALTRTMGSQDRINPASLAFEKPALQPTFPSIGVRSTGPASSDAATSFLLDGTRASDAISIAGQYGSSPSMLGVNGYAAVSYGKFEISGNAVGSAHIIPNAAWSSFVKGGTNQYINLAPSAQADVYSAGYYTAPALGFSTTLPGSDVSVKSDVIGIGLRVKDMVGLYSHRIVRPDTDPTDGYVDNISANPAPEMDGASQLRKTGIGADLGLMLRPKAFYGFSVGLVAENFVKPAFVFPATDVNGNATKFNILQSTVSAGIGYEAKGGLTLAADAANIGSGRDLNGDPTQDFRVGIEQKLFKSMALRGGYSKLDGATYGFGFFGVDLAFGGKVPLEVVRTLNF